MSDKYNQRWVLWFAPKQHYEWAITIGQVTYYSCDEKRVGQVWRSHEAIHKRQWAKQGFFTFAITYLYYLVLHGYWDNPYEKEARGAQ